jgi:hypothetical protein
MEKNKVMFFVAVALYGILRNDCAAVTCIRASDGLRAPAQAPSV